MVFVTRKFRGGIIKEVEVDLAWKPDCLQIIYDNFGFREFNVSDIEAHYPNIPRTTLIFRLDTLWRNKWLRKTSCGVQSMKDCRKYQLREPMVNQYLEKFDSLDDPEGILVKSIKPKIRYVERQVEVPVVKKFQDKIYPIDLK